MPVPVPKYCYPSAHPVIKPHRHSDPPYPTAIPPSITFPKSNGFSLCHSWRASKPHRIWEDDAEVLGFSEGLTSAGNAQVIKGARAQACLPPISSLAHHSDVYGANYRHSARDMTYDPLSYPEDDDDVDFMQISPTENRYSGTYGIFSPFLDDQSPDPLVEFEHGSSPIGPLTPFCDPIDRAMAANPGDAYASGKYDGYPECLYGVSSDCTQVHQTKPSNKQPPASDTSSAPSASVDYKRLVDHLSEWLAGYIWKVCTTGTGLPHAFFRPSSYLQRYSRGHPPHLAGSIRSLLLSTLLQPSAIFLSLWYIMRLPVYIGPVAFGSEYLKESRFRAELLCDSEHTAESHAPFRVFLLGCMLANKWLDDHTFSNKTWHTITNVSVRSLNELEILALDNFCHDISISPQQWSQWLSHLLSYHSSLASPTCPQPISRPSTNPHAIIRRSLEELFEATVTNHDTCQTLPEPVFLGLEQRKREKLERDEASTENMLDIDLDEDGPLREEYLPKRRVSRSEPLQSKDEYMDKRAARPRQVAENVRALPPPAKWSPAGDEPISRDRNCFSGQYIASRAPLLRAPAIADVSVLDNVGLWSFFPVKRGFNAGYGYESSGLGQVQFPYEYGYPYEPTHVRSQSFSYAQENMQPRLHSRSHSQAHAGYSLNSVLQENNRGPPHYTPDQFGYYGHPFVDESALNYTRYPMRA